MKILMVCLGNICRSPLAEGILQHKVAQRGLNWVIDSAGTGSWHIGHSPDRRSMQIAQKYGIDISRQRARKLQYDDLETFDLILAMDQQNFYDIQRLSRTTQQQQKIVKILDFAHHDPHAEVPDPYYDNRFELVYHLLDAAADALIERILKTK